VQQGPEQLRGTILGVSLVTIATFRYAIGAVITKKWLSEVPLEGLVATALTAASIMLLPFALLEAVPPLPSPPVVGAIMVLGLLCTAGGFLSFFQLIRLAGSVRATLITYTAPLVAIAAGVLFLQESVTSAVTVQGPLSRRAAFGWVRLHLRDPLIRLLGRAGAGNGLGGHAGVVRVARACGVGADRRECRESNCGRASLSRRTTRGYPGGLLAFMRQKFVGSYLALRATSRVHWLSVYACRIRSAASSLV